ncbi:hypothetical protein ASD25_18985 [Brevundimonas sp. Root1423]|nr:hypothetical protein ASD25_18985 [Brevundimonas sp. Root1423]
MLHVRDTGVEAGDHLRTDRQLGGAKTQGLTGDVVRHAVDFMRTSAGLPVTGRSGKTRIQTRP